MELGRALDGGLAVGRQADDGESALLQQRSESVTRQRVVVDDQDPRVHNS